MQTTFRTSPIWSAFAFAGLTLGVGTADLWAQASPAPKTTDKNVQTAPREERVEGRETARDARREGREQARDLRQSQNSSLRAPDLGMWFKRGTPGTGLVVSHVASDGAMAKAGFQQGDQLVSINGQRVTTEAEFMRQLLADELSSQDAKVVVKRGGQEQTITLQPATLLKEAVAEDPFWRQGIVVDDRDPNQIVILRVYPRTPAYYAGLRAGDRIVGLRGQRIGRLIDLAQQLADAAGKIAVQINRGNETHDLEINSGNETDAEVHTTLKPPLPDSQRLRLDGGPRIEAPKSPAPVPQQP